jgi:hypothetical protein
MGLELLVEGLDVSSMNRDAQVGMGLSLSERERKALNQPARSTRTARDIPWNQLGGRAQLAAAGFITIVLEHERPGDTGAFVVPVPTDQRPSANCWNSSSVVGEKVRSTLSPAVTVVVTVAQE